MRGRTWRGSYLKSTSVMKQEEKLRELCALYEEGLLSPSQEIELSNLAEKKRNREKYSDKHNDRDPIDTAAKLQQTAQEHIQFLQKITPKINRTPDVADQINRIDELSKQKTLSHEETIELRNLYAKDLNRTKTTLDKRNKKQEKQEDQKNELDESSENEESYTSPKPKPKPEGLVKNWGIFGQTYSSAKKQSEISVHEQTSSREEQEDPNKDPRIAPEFDSKALEKWMNDECEPLAKKRRIDISNN